MDNNFKICYQFLIIEFLWIYIAKCVIVIIITIIIINIYFFLTANDTLEWASPLTTMCFMIFIETCLIFAKFSWYKL